MKCLQEQKNERRKKRDDNDVVFFLQTKIKAGRHSKSKSLVPTEVGSSQMTTCAHRCLKRFHTFRVAPVIHNYYDIITAHGEDFTTMRYPVRTFKTKESAPFGWYLAEMPQSLCPHGAMQHQWTKCTVYKRDNSRKKKTRFKARGFNDAKWAHWKYRYE